MKIFQADIEKELISITTQLLAESGEQFKREVRLDVSLQRHLGIDSLARAELFQRIQKIFDVVLPDRLLAEAESLQDIANYLREAGSAPSATQQQKIITSHGERPHVDPSRAQTLTDILFLYGEQSPNKTHIFFQNEDGNQEVITYGEMLNSSLRVAQGLKERGLQEGETVAIMLPTHPGFFYAFFGTLLAGGIPVPIYPPFRMHMLEAYAKTEARILRNAEVRFLVTFTQAQKLSRVLQTFVPSLKLVTTVADLLEPNVLKNPFSAKSDNFAFIQYTSGSTSDPKGVLLTHSNLMANIRAYGKVIKVTPDDVGVSWLPLYHDMGLIGMWLGSLYFGAPLILMTPFSFLNHPERWLWAIHYHRGTVTGAPNFAYELCVRKIDPSMIEGLDLSSWRVAANGAEKVYPRTLEEFTKKFAPYGLKRSTLLPVYGLAESTVGLIMPPLGCEFKIDHVNRKDFEEDRHARQTAPGGNALEFVSCGVPLENHEVRIVDNENKVLSERHVGNLQFRGPSSMQGYYNNPRATEAVYHEGGWIDSGDLAYQAAGEFYITGRRKDLIIKAGRNIYPAEVEEIVGAVPGIRQGCVAAFEVSDPERATEQMIVVAETREDDKTKLEQLSTAVKEAIATSLDILPDHVVLVAPHSVPKTSSGKLQRAACKTLYQEGRLGKTHVPPWMQIARLGTQSIISKTLQAFNKLGKCLYTAYIALILAITVPPLYLVVLLGSRRVAAQACRFWARLLLKSSLCPVAVLGAEKLNQSTPVIFTANHASYIDSIIAMAILPIETRFVGKKELLSAPILGTFMRKLDYIPVDRLDLPKGIEDTKNMESALKTGHPVLIFPEGTFSYSSGLRPFRLGAFKIAVDTNIPICPVALRGTRSILRNNEKLLRPGPITVTVLDLVQPAGTEWQDVIQLRNEARAEIAKYCGEPSLDYIAAQTIAPKQP